MGNGSLSPKEPSSRGLENDFTGRLESSAATTQACVDRSTSGPQASTEAPAIVESSNIQQSGQGPQPQAIPPSTDPQHPPTGSFEFQGPQSFSHVGSSSHMAQIQTQGPVGPFSMGDMSRAMREHNLLMPTGQQYGQPQQQQFPVGPLSASTPALVYQIQPEMPQLAGHATVSYQNNRMWPVNYPQHYQAVYQQNPHSTVGSGYPQFMQPHQVQPPGINPIQSPYPNTRWPLQQEQPHQPPNSYAYLATSYCASGTLPGHGVGSHSAPPYPASYPRRSSLPARQSSVSRPDGEYEGIYSRGGIPPSSGYPTNNPKTRSGSVPSEL
jgi:hypothetical protein